ncbi:hypothetical protein B0H13DRAFT_2305222 [Mycena leptocephala]|nr:hypothetical protein B0H13DRAFT_2305222 [Mycena leptocephala]
MLQVLPPSLSIVFERISSIFRLNCIASRSIPSLQRHDSDVGVDITEIRDWYLRLVSRAISTITVLATLPASSVARCDALAHAQPSCVHRAVAERGGLPARVLCRLPLHGPRFRVTVQGELEPIEGLKTAVDLAQAIRGIFKCYRWLYEVAKVMHRDISVGNLIYRYLNNGQIVGVLNDFDLSLLLSEIPASTSTQRTGTKPYMAIDLLVPAPPFHLYRHDLESLFYIILLGMEDLRKEKVVFMSASPPPPTANFQCLDIAWIRPMMIMFALGFHAHLVHSLAGNDPLTFDEASHVTFDEFAEIMDKEVSN